MIISLVKFHLIHPHIYYDISPLSPRFSLSNARKYSCSISSIITTLHSWLLPILFLKIYFVFIYEWYFHRVLNSRSAFQRYQSIVCGLLLFLWGVFLWRQCAFFLASFILFSGCLYNFLLCLCLWQFYYDISVSVFFSLLVCF